LAKILTKLNSKSQEEKSCFCTGKTPFQKGENSPFLLSFWFLQKKKTTFKALLRGVINSKKQLNVSIAFI